MLEESNAGGAREGSSESGQLTSSGRDSLIHSSINFLNESLLRGAVCQALCDVLGIFSIINSINDS